jgi:cyclase
MPLAKRVIAHLSVKPPNKLVKGIQLEGLRNLGDPHERATRYATGGADELLLMDVDASLDGRCGIVDLVARTASGVFIPITAGGGIRSIQDIRSMFMAGADKVAINTGAIRNPAFITEAARQFGSQAVVVAIEYNGNLCFTDCGREHTGLNPYDWAMKAVDLGAGELILTSIERDGTRRGYDLEMIAKIAHAVPVPVIAHGGCGKAEHIREAAEAGADGMACATVLHYGHFDVAELKESLHGNAVRTS